MINYRDKILECVNALGRAKLATIQEWFVNRGEMPPSDITVKKHLAFLLAEQKIERPAFGLYCALGKSPIAPKITPWVECELKRRYPDFLTPGQLRIQYAAETGLKLSLELFEKAIDELMRQELLVSYRGKAFAWDARPSPTKGN